MGMASSHQMSDTAVPSDAMKLDGTTEATLARSLSALPPDERGWITFAEARTLFSTEGTQYAFGETDQDGRRNIGGHGLSRNFAFTVAIGGKADMTCCAAYVRF